MAGEERELPFEYSSRDIEILKKLFPNPTPEQLEAIEAAEHNKRDLEEYLKKSKIVPSIGGIPRAAWLNGNGDGGIDLLAGDSVSRVLVTNPDSGTLYMAVTVATTITAEGGDGSVEGSISITGVPFVFTTTRYFITYPDTTINVTAVGPAGASNGNDIVITFGNFGDTNFHVDFAAVGIEVQEPGVGLS